MKPMNALEQEDLQRELIHMAKRSKARRRLILSGVFVVLAVIALGATWLWGRSLAEKNAQDKIAELEAVIREQEDRIKEITDDPIVVTPIAPTINLKVLRSEIKDIGELATTEYLFTDAARFSDSKQFKNWNIPLTEKSFILKWSGVIKAGIDVTQVTIEVDESAKKVIVTVPPATILSFTIDNDSVEVVDENNNIFNPISVNDKVNFDSKTEEAMKERAIENGLLEKAQTNAETILKYLIQSDSAISNSYTVEFVVE